MIYGLTKSFPADERFGLVSQMRRAAVSIPSNIAEGQARRTTGEFIQFMSHAEGSLAELETQVIVSVDLGTGNDPSSMSSFLNSTNSRKCSMPLGASFPVDPFSSSGLSL